MTCGGVVACVAPSGMPRLPIWVQYLVMSREAPERMVFWLCAAVRSVWPLQGWLPRHWCVALR